MPSVFLLFTLLMMFGCGALARYTLKTDTGSHILYAAMAFVSQLLLLTMLVVSAYTVCRLKNTSGRITTLVKSAIFFTVLSVVMLVLFGASVGSKPYVFEFALLACMYLGSCSLALEKWLDMHNLGSRVGHACSASVLMTHRPSTRFEVV